jgi:WD40 repeat protein
MKVQEKSRELAEALSQQEQQKLAEAVAKEGPAKGLAYLARALRRNPDNHRAAYRLLSILSYRDVARLVSQKKFDGKVIDTCYSALGPLVLTRTGDRDLWLWDYRQNQPLAGPLRHEVLAARATFSPSGQKFLVILANWTVEVWRTTNTAAPLCTLKAEQDPGSLLFSPDESTLLTSSSGEGGDSRRLILRVWDLHTGQPLTKPVRYDAQGLGAGFVYTPDGKQVRIVEHAGIKRIESTLDIATGNLSPKQEFSNVGYSADEAVAMRPQVYTQYAQQGTISITPLGPPYSSREVLFPLASVMESSAEYGERPAVFVSNQNLSADGQQLLTVSNDGTVSLWDVGLHTVVPARIALSRESSETLYSDQMRPYIELSGDGRKLLVMETPATVRIHDTQTGSVLVNPLAEPGKVALARFSPDGAKVAIALTNGWLRLWDASSGQPITQPFRENGTYLRPKTFWLRRLRRTGWGTVSNKT